MTTNEREIKYEDVDIAHLERLIAPMVSVVSAYRESHGDEKADLDILEEAGGDDRLEELIGVISGMIVDINGNGNADFGMNMIIGKAVTAFNFLSYVCMLQAEDNTVTAHYLLFRMVDAMSAEYHERQALMQAEASHTIH